jgi:hypothetical protein
MREQGTFIPDNILNSKSVHVYETLMCNARISPRNIQSMKEMLKEETKNEDIYAPASTKIYDAIVSERQFDLYGRPIKRGNRKV